MNKGDWTRRPEELREEMERVNGMIQGIANHIDSSHVPLAQRIRLNFQRIELEAYGRGLRYALGDADQPRMTPTGGFEVGRLSEIPGPNGKFS